MDIEKQLYSSGQVIVDETIEAALNKKRHVRFSKPRSVFKWRESWLGFLPAFLVFYSFIKEVKVGEPFLYKYQVEFLNLTAEQIKSEIYPYNPYSYMIALIPIFILTDFLLYKPTMLLEILGQIGFRASLVFFSSVFSQIIGTISYAVASASEIGFFAYAYGRLEKDQYRTITSWIRAGTMTGRTFGYGLSQLIIMCGLGNYLTLNQIAFFMPCIVLIFCMSTPSISWKRMAKRIFEARATLALTESNVKLYPMPRSYGEYLKQRISTLHSDFGQIYGSSIIRRWSFYWAIGTCLSLQFALLSQTLWGTLQPKDTPQSPLNGFAESSYTFLAAISILAVNSLNLNWEVWGEAVLIVISIIDAVLTFIYAKTDNIYIMQICYIIYRSLYQVMITISQWNIAKNLKSDNFALVFGCNSFFALLMQCILTAIVTDSHGLDMGIREQYLVYGSCHIIVALIFATCVFYRGCKSLCGHSSVSPTKNLDIYVMESK